MLFLYIFAEAERAGQKGFDNGVQNTSAVRSSNPQGGAAAPHASNSHTSVLASQNRKKKKKGNKNWKTYFSLFWPRRKFSVWTRMRRRNRSFLSAARKTKPSGLCSRNTAEREWTPQCPAEGGRERRHVEYSKTMREVWKLTSHLKFNLWLNLTGTCQTILIETVVLIFSSK